MSQLLNKSLVVIFLLSASLSHACKEAALNENFPIKNFESYDTIVIATVTAVIENTKSQYGGFSSFTATVQESLKGSAARGAIISGKSAIEEPKAVCPPTLNTGSTYLLLLNRQDNTYSLSRFSFPTEAKNVYYLKYIEQVKASVNGS